MRTGKGKPPRVCDTPLSHQGWRSSWLGGVPWRREDSGNATFGSLPFAPSEKLGLLSGALRGKFARSRLDGQKRRRRRGPRGETYGRAGPSYTGEGRGMGGVFFCGRN